MFESTKSGSPAMSPSVTARVRKFRARQRKAGLKSVQLWIPDVSKPGFVAECRRQATRVAKSPDERRIVREIEALTIDREKGAVDWA